MDAGSSIQAFFAIALFTSGLMAFIRLVGHFAAKTHPSPPDHTEPAKTPDDLSRLIAILTAAAMEALDTDDVFLTSVVELPEPGGHKHWPRLGTMHFYRKPGSAL